jgi:hypothetical protein
MPSEESSLDGRQFSETRGRHGWTEQKSLALHASVVNQKTPLYICFYAFSDDIKFECLS